MHLQFRTYKGHSDKAQKNKLAIKKKKNKLTQRDKVQFVD